MSKMTFTDLIQEISDRSMISSSAVRDVLRTLVLVVDENMQVGKQTPLHGLGYFDPLLSEVDSHRNPKTGEVVHLGTFVKPFFRFTQNYRVSLRENADLEEAKKNIKS